MGQMIFGEAKEEGPNQFDLIRDGDRHAREGDSDAAIAAFTAAIARHPTYFVGYLRRGMALLAAGEHDKALADLDECLRYHAGDVDAIEGKAQCYEAMGDDDLAVRERSRIPREVRDAIRARERAAIEAAAVCAVADSGAVNLGPH